MSSRLQALCFGANDLDRLATFWAALLGGAEPTWNSAGNGLTLRPADLGFQLDFRATRAPKSTPNRMHFDLTSTSLADQQHTVATALALGARGIDVGQRPDEPHVVLADPEGNEFCVIEPGNAFLADCGLVGAVAGDGSQQAGYFWSAALGWPLVWDEREETAIRSPHGGPKITWGGPPVRAKIGRNRLHFELAPSAGADQGDEVARLVGLGATRLDDGRPDANRVLLADPDGNEFCLLSPR